MNKASVGGGRKLRDPPGGGGAGGGGNPVLCKRSLSSSQGTILMAAKLGKGALWEWRGHDLYSSSVSWPLAEVLSVRKGTLGCGSGSNCPGGLAGRWMDRALEGTRAKFNATFREKTAPSSLRPSLAFGVRLLGIFSVQPLAQSHLSPRPGRQGPSLSGYLSLPRSELHPHTGGEAGPESPRSLVCPAPPTIFGFRSGVTGGGGYSWT